MDWKKKRLQNSKLYLILDAEVDSYERLIETIEESISSGVDIVQLRDKCGHAKDMVDFSRRAMRLIAQKAIYIVNDRADVALACQADGIHLGQDDLDVSFARDLLGPNYLIGKSCQSIEHLVKAQEEQVDYIGFGSVFTTQTKPERNAMDLKVLNEAAQTAAVPLFAIGGIKLSNIDEVLQCSVERVAVCREILKSSNVQQTVSRLCTKLS